MPSVTITPTATTPKLPSSQRLETSLVQTKHPVIVSYIEEGNPVWSSTIRNTDERKPDLYIPTPFTSLQTIRIEYNNNDSEYPLSFFKTNPPYRLGFGARNAGARHPGIPSTETVTTWVRGTYRHIQFRPDMITTNEENFTTTTCPHMDNTRKTTWAPTELSKSYEVTTTKIPKEHIRQGQDPFTTSQSLIGNSFEIDINTSQEKDLVVDFNARFTLKTEKSTIWTYYPHRATQQGTLPEIPPLENLSLQIKTLGADNTYKLRELVEGQQITDHFRTLADVRQLTVHLNKTATERGNFTIESKVRLIFREIRGLPIAPSKQDTPCQKKFSNTQVITYKRPSDSLDNYIASHWRKHIISTSYNQPSAIPPHPTVSLPVPRKRTSAEASTGSNLEVPLLRRARADESNSATRGGSSEASSSISDQTHAISTPPLNDDNDDDDDDILQLFTDSALAKPSSQANSSSLTSFDDEFNPNL